MSRLLGTGRHHGFRDCCCRSARSMAAVAGGAIAAPGVLTPASPYFASGNYHVGGAGKTPTVLTLAKYAARTRRDAGRAQSAAMADDCAVRSRWILSGMSRQMSATSP